MAQFAGIFDAPVVELAPCGLLSVARVITHGLDDEKWVRSYEYQAYSSPTVRILNTDGLTVTNGTIHDGTNDPTFFDGSSFFVELEKKRSGMGIIGANPLEEIADEMEAATQKAAEYELWEGVAIQAGTSDAPYLIKNGSADIVNPTPGTGVAASKALALLEEAISNSPVGARGTIHMTRDVASTLGSELVFRENPDHATTRLGTYVVIGSGYTGNGPLGATTRAATVTNKWMFATGSVVVHEGQSVIVNDSLSQGFDPSTNDSIVKAERALAVHFDPSIWYAAQVTLP